MFFAAKLFPDLKTETTPEKETALSRRALINERKKNSLFWQVVHLLGSLQLALILLATIALACAIATFAESHFDTAVAHAAIYKAPWFMAWLTVLCINLFAVTLTRWPWEKKHVGFIITHYGIITLLLGAIIGMTWGFEGNVTLHRGTPLTKITTRKSVLQIESPNDTFLYLLPYDAAIAHPSTKHPTRLSVPGTELQLIIDDWSKHLEQQPFLQPSNDLKAPAALLLRLQSTLLHQEQIVPLTLVDSASGTFDFFGLATLQFFSTLSASHPTSHHESQLVAAHFAPVIVFQDQPSGIKITLSKDGNLVTITTPEGTSASYPRTALMGQKLVLGTTTMIVKEYWPDFKLVDGKPTTLSQQPKNPAFRAEITFSSTTIEQPAGKTTPWLRMSLNQDFKSIQYQLGRGSSIQKSGTLAMNASMPLGWADWECQLLAAGPHEEIGHSIVPLRETTESKSDRSSAPPGFHAYLADPEHHQQGPPQWVISGAVTSLILDRPLSKLADASEAQGGSSEQPRSAQDAHEDASTEATQQFAAAVEFGKRSMVRVAYGLELKSVPFSIELLNFEVPRDEGTETPSDFRATVRFKNLKTGDTKDGLIHMNHPASFPGTFWANFTGINYKFSQAEWNPRDLEETTLQVLYDPGWLFKWVGSLAICLGIAMMFYWGKKK